MSFSYIFIQMHGCAFQGCWATLPLTWENNEMLNYHVAPDFVFFFT